MCVVCCVCESSCVCVCGVLCEYVCCGYIKVVFSVEKLIAGV